MDWLKIQHRINIKNYYSLKRKKKAKEIINYDPNRKPRRISTCGWCGRQYIKYANKQKYCSDECRDSARSHQSRMKSHRWYHKHKHELTEKQRWGLGSSTIGQHRHDDFEREQEVITKELSRLGLKKKRR